MATQKQIEIMKRLQDSRKNGINAVLKQISVGDLRFLNDFVTQHVTNELQHGVELEEIPQLKRLLDTTIKLGSVTRLLLNCEILDDIQQVEKIDVDFNVQDLAEIGETIHSVLSND